MKRRQCDCLASTGTWKAPGRSKAAAATDRPADNQPGDDEGDDEKQALVLLDVKFGEIDRCHLEY